MRSARTNTLRHTVAHGVKTYRGRTANGGQVAPVDFRNVLDMRLSDDLLLFANTLKGAASLLRVYKPSSRGIAFHPRT